MRFPRATLAMFGVFLLALSGCKEDEGITREKVVQEDREKIRLRVAIIEKGDLVWFFKLSGPVDAVAAHSPAYEDFVRSVKFDAENLPSWTDPKGWTKDPKGKDRFAGYRIKTKKKDLEIAVTRLPVPEKGFNLMSNMHRWQKQVNVPLTEEHRVLEEQVKREKLASGAEARWVDLQGLGIHTVTKPPDPMAANQKKFIPMMPPPKAAGGKSKSPFKSDVPKDWVVKPSRQFAIEVYDITDGKANAEVTLTPLPGAAGGIASNVNRWRGELQLAELAPADAEKTTQPIVVAGIKSAIVDIDNPNGPAARNRTLGVIVPLGGTTWFIKLSGPRELVGRNKDAFEAYVKSFKLAR